MNDTETFVAEKLPKGSALHACSVLILALLKKYPKRYVTAGWCVDRGIGHSEYVVSVVLRRLSAAKKIDRVFEHGHQWYAFRDDLTSLILLREAQKRRKQKMKEDREQEHADFMRAQQEESEYEPTDT